MNSNPGWAKGLRILAIVLMGITAFFTLASGAGTVCVAFAAERFGDSMAPLTPYKWLYVLFVILTLAIGVMGVRATVMLVRGRAGAVRFAILTLIAGIVVGGIHIIVSRALRGKSMPTDPVVYTTLLTLLLFLILRTPALRAKVDLERPRNDSSTHTLAAAITLLACGLLALTVPLWAGASHTFEVGGINWANAWPTLMNTTGALLCLGGIALFLEMRFHLSQRLKNHPSYLRALRGRASDPRCGV